jgi:hypothetical protein
MKRRKTSWQRSSASSSENPWRRMKDSTGSRYLPTKSTTAVDLPSRASRSEVQIVV